MKRFKLKYQLLVLICAIVSSCTNEDFINMGTEGNTQISLKMELSDSPQSDVSGLYDRNTERYINDVAVYIFSKDNNFIEQVNNPSITGNDGDATRTIFGTLRADYSSYKSGIDIVVLANLTARGVKAPTLSIGQNKESLYSQVSYDYTPGAEWQFSDNPKQYIPMWGSSSIDAAIQSGMNRGSLSLYRAIARVDVTFNGGKGFDHFTPTGIKVNYYNNKGYYATANLNMPNIPESSNRMQSGAEFFQPDAETQTYRLYIPEYKNSGSEICKIELTGDLVTEDITIEGKTYTLEFKDGDNQLDILRNNLYRFNITKITSEIAITSTLNYEVEKWEYTTVDVPAFN